MLGHVPPWVPTAAHVVPTTVPLPGTGLSKLVLVMTSGERAPQEKVSEITGGTAPSSLLPRAPLLPWLRGLEMETQGGFQVQGLRGPSQAQWLCETR